MTEASWGADPLTLQGGFRAPAYENENQYLSSLAPDGRVSWSTHRLENSSSSGSAVEASMTIGFPNVDWPLLQSVYGWAALQYQAWARGQLIIAANSTQSLLFYADNVLELWVDDDHYFGGDYYAYRRAPLILHLNPGSHNIGIRLIRDVRVMGSIGEPTISIKLKAESSNDNLALMGQKALMPDIIDGVLASSFASVTVCNQGRKAIDVLHIMTDLVFLRILSKTPTLLTVSRGYS